MRALAVALALTLAAAWPADAGPHHFFTDKKWWAGVAVIGLATALDAHSSCQAASRGAVETNPFISGHPSCGQIAAVEAGAFGYWSICHAVEWHFSHDDTRKYVRVIGLSAMPVAALAVHLPGTIHNYQIPPPR